MPRETLTADQIVRATIGLLDAEGLDGLNMRSLGKQLDSAPTAIYWHVKTKDDLVMLAGDAIWTEIELPDPATTDWRTAAATLASDLHAMLTRHPWYVQAFGSHLLVGAGKSGFDDTALAIFEDAGFAPDDADRAATTLFLFVLGNALGPAMEISLARRLNRTGGKAEQRIAETMRQSSEIAMRFPRLRERLRTTASTQYFAAPDGSFEFGLVAVLDGLEAALRTASTATAD